MLTQGYTSTCTLLGSHSAELMLSIAHLSELKSHPETVGDVSLMYLIPSMPSPALAILKNRCTYACGRMLKTGFLLSPNKIFLTKESCINKNYLSGKSGTVLTERLKGDCPMSETLPWRLRIRFSPLNSVV